jgi:cell division protein FtsW (lipid II flippase)
MMYAATGRITYVLFGSMLFLTGFPILYLIFSHVQKRMESWLDPWSDPHGNGYQITQNLFSIAEGGNTGTGLSQGFFQTIPEVHNDFIFTTIASELGLLGATAVLLLFLVFVCRGTKIDILAHDPASKLLAGGSVRHLLFRLSSSWEG